MRKIVIVGGMHPSSVTAALAVALADIACASQGEGRGEMELHARPDFPDIQIAPVPSHDECGAAWYQRFAGRSGKRRRY